MKLNKLTSLLFAAAVFFITVTSAEAQDSKTFGLVIHGGAGTITKENMTPEMEKEYTAKLNEAMDKGYQILKAGGKSLDAVQAVINIMEDSPLFNSGKGAVLTAKGRAELDASIMDGRTLAAGAVAGVTHVKNPISLARLVMEKSPHVMLIGEGAEEFGKEMGVEMVDTKYFITPQRWESYQKALKKEEEKNKIEKHGTVGCVALDKDGNLAAGTSTGGMMMKKFGRVGDSPIIGAGTYAKNSTCAVSATGWGEYFIRLGIAKDISDLIEYKGMSLNDAANLVIMKKLPDLGGDGGIIAVNQKGEVAMVFNTAGMYRGYHIGGGEPVIKIYKE